MNKKFLFTGFESIKITEGMRKDVLEHPEKYMNCPVRIRGKNFYTDEEYEQYIEKSLNRSLPGDEKKVKKLVFNNK